MSKPFKSQFDLMAEAYGNVNYSKQRIINEDTAGKTVIGYPPSEDNETGQQAGHSAGDTSVEARNARFHELEMAKARNPKSEDAEGDDDYYYDESDYNRVLDLVDKEGREWKESSVLSGVKEDHVDQFLKDMQGWMDKNGIDGGPGVKDHKEGLFAASLRKAAEAGEDEDYEEPGPQLGGDLDPGEVDDDIQEPIEDAEEAGFNRKQLDELEDIVHAILDKRDHEDRAAKHEDGEY